MLQSKSFSLDSGTQDLRVFDAFYQDWSHENCLVVPPVPIVARVGIFMFHNGFKGTLVVPYWTSASYWPLIAH